MCVAVIVESKDRIPSEYLKAMAEHNPDGGGVAWIDGDLIQYRKGLTWQQIDSFQHLLPRPFLLHFRIATRGGKIPELTHPFPVGMQAFTDDLTGMAPAVLIHNGTWMDFRKHVPEGIDANLVSDTQTAAYVAETNEKILDEVKWSNAIMKAKGNGRADLTLRGHWTDFKGNQYSNLHWLSELRFNKMDNDEWNQYFYGRTPTPRIVEPIQARKKGHQKGRTQENGKTVNPIISKRAAKRAAKQAKREAAKLESAHERALVNFNKSRGGTVTQNENAPHVVRNRAPTKTWESDRLFTEDELRGSRSSMEPVMTSANSVPCPYCKQEITQIPCQCGGFDDDELDLIVDAEFEEVDTQVYDLEDLNDYGMALGMDGFDMPDEELILDGNRPEDWKKVDDWIRANGIKI